LNCVLKSFCNFSQVSSKSVQSDDRFELVRRSDKDFHKLSSKTSPY